MSLIFWKYNFKNMEGASNALVIENQLPIISNQEEADGNNLIEEMKVSNTFPFHTACSK